MKHIIVAGIVAVLGFVASGCETDTSSDEKVGKADMKVEATKILKEFENNEAAADGKYKDKTLEVSGVVAKIDTQVMDDEKYNIQIGGGGQFEMFTVNCNGQSADAVAKIKKGQKITVVGKFDDGGDLGVELEPCEVK